MLVHPHTIPLSTANKLQEFIVDRDSAVLGFYNSLGLQVNHFQLNKFSGPHDHYYLLVREQILNMIKEALKTPETSKEMRMQCLQILSSAQYSCIQTLNEIPL